MKSQTGKRKRYNKTDKINDLTKQLNEALYHLKNMLKENQLYRNALQKYVENDDSLLSSSQLSANNGVTTSKSEEDEEEDYPLLSQVSNFSAGNESMVEIMKFLDDTNYSLSRCVSFNDKNENNTTNTVMMDQNDVVVDCSTSSVDCTSGIGNQSILHDATIRTNNLSIKDDKQKLNENKMEIICAMGTSASSSIIPSPTNQQHQYLNYTSHSATTNNKMLAEIQIKVLLPLIVPPTALNSSKMTDNDNNYKTKESSRNINAIKQWLCTTNTSNIPRKEGMPTSTPNVQYTNSTANKIDNSLKLKQTPFLQKLELPQGVMLQEHPTIQKCVEKIIRDATGVHLNFPSASYTNVKFKFTTLQHNCDEIKHKNHHPKTTTSIVLYVLVNNIDPAELTRIPKYMWRSFDDIMKNTIAADDDLKVLYSAQHNVKFPSN